MHGGCGMQLRRSRARAQACMHACMHAFISAAWQAAASPATSSSGSHVPATWMQMALASPVDTSEPSVATWRTRRGDGDACSNARRAPQKCAVSGAAVDSMQCSCACCMLSCAGPHLELLHAVCWQEYAVPCRPAARHCHLVIRRPVPQVAARQVLDQVPALGVGGAAGGSQQQQQSMAKAQRAPDSASASRVSQARVL